MSRNLSENTIRRIIRQVLNEAWSPALPAREAAEALSPYLNQFINTLNTNEQLQRVLLYGRYGEEAELYQTLTEALDYAKKLKFCLNELGVADEEED